MVFCTCPLFSMGCRHFYNKGVELVSTRTIRFGHAFVNLPALFFYFSAHVSPLLLPPPPHSQHKRQSYVLYKGTALARVTLLTFPANCVSHLPLFFTFTGGRIDVENVWATELHPVSSFENKDTRMDKKPLAVANFATRDRRSSLAVTNDGKTP